MLGFAHFQIGRTRNRRTRINQVGWVELFGAVFALIAARFVIAAIGAGALNVAIRQEPAVGNGEDLFFRHFADQPVIGQPPGEMLGQSMVLRAGGAAEMVESSFRNGAQFRTEWRAFLRSIRRPVCPPWRRPVRLACRVRRWRTGTTLRCRACAQVSGIKVGRQLRTDQGAQVFDPVDVGDRRGDQNDEP